MATKAEAHAASAAHTEFPHFRTDGPHAGNCMCEAPCCYSPSGCRCLGCAGIDHFNCPAARRRAKSEKES